MAAPRMHPPCITSPPPSPQVREGVEWLTARVLRLQEHCAELAEVLSGALGLQLLGAPDGGDAAEDVTPAPHPHPLLLGGGAHHVGRPWLESAFKSSAAKKDGLRRYMAMNLHVQVRRAMVDGGEEEGRWEACDGPARLV